MCLSQSTSDDSLKVKLRKISLLRQQRNKKTEQELQRNFELMAILNVPGIGLLSNCYKMRRKYFQGFCSQLN